MMTKIDTEIKHQRKLKDDKGYMIYQKVCNEMGWNDNALFYFGGVKSVELIHNPKNNNLKLQSYNFTKKDALNLIENDECKTLFSYIMRNKRFSTDPVLITDSYITYESKGAKEGYVLRDELKGKSIDEILEWASAIRTNINYKIGEYSVNIPIQKVIDRGNSYYMNKLINIIIPDKIEQKAFKEYVALYTFEYRYGLAKPTLVMFGKRNTGKNLLIDYFLGSIYPEQIQPAPNNIDNFNAALQNKGLFYDEKTDKSSGKKSYKFYDELKKMSGSKNNSINKKGKEVYTVQNGCYIMIASNEKPFDLRDEIQDSNSNQFLVLEMNVTKGRDIASFEDEITNLGKGYHRIVDFIKKNIGDYISTELWSVYQKMKIEAKQKSYRYGMDIPITVGLLNIQAKSISNSEKLCIQVLEDLYNNDPETYKLDGKECLFFEEFSNPQKGSMGFLANIVREQCLKAFKLNSNAFFHTLEKFKLIKTANTTKTIIVGNDFDKKSKRQQGTRIDFERLSNLIKSQSWYGEPEIINVADRLNGFKDAIEI